jgi:hypothetical protein
LLYKGIETEEDYFYFEGRIAEAQFFKEVGDQAVSHLPQLSTEG